MVQDKDALQAEESVEEEVQPETIEEPSPAPEVVTKDSLDKELTALRQQLKESEERSSRFQSVADSRSAEARTAFQQNRQLQSRVEAIEAANLSQLDPEEQWKRRMEMQQAQLLAQQGVQQQTGHHPQLVWEVLRVGISENDPRIDWGSQNVPGEEGALRFFNSLNRIKQEDATTKEEPKEEIARAEEVAKAKKGPVETPTVETQGSGARSRSYAETEQGYIEGTVTESDYRKARQERGLE